MVEKYIIINIYAHDMTNTTEEVKEMLLGACLRSTGLLWELASIKYIFMYSIMFIRMIMCQLLMLVRNEVPEIIKWALSIQMLDTRGGCTCTSTCAFTLQSTKTTNQHLHFNDPPVHTKHNGMLRF